MEVCASPSVLSTPSANPPVLIHRVLSSLSAKSPVLRKKAKKALKNKIKCQEEYIISLHICLTLMFLLHFFSSLPYFRN